MVLLELLKPKHILYLLIAFVCGCSTNNKGTDTNIVIIPKEEVITRLDLDKKFSPLDSPELLKSKYDFGKSDPFNASPSQNNILLRNFAENPRFYFVHSYYIHPFADGLSCMRSFYGIEFDCALQKDNLFAVQFHPEKSHRYGFTLLKTFLEI